jgi:hypothetical protein
VARVGFEKRLKLRGEPRVVMGLKVVVLAEGEASLGPRRNRLEPPGTLLDEVGASVVVVEVLGLELEGDEASYSYSSSYSSPSPATDDGDDCVGVTVVEA